MHKKIAFYSAFFSLVLAGCKSDLPADSTGSSNIEESEQFEPIEELFTETTFSDSLQPRLLQELGICSDTTATPCSAENFKFFPLQKKGSLENGFILLIKAETGGFPLRRTLVFQRERGELVKINGFVANLIGRYPQASGYDDLLLRFRDKDGNQMIFYNCLFTWKEGKYEFKQVEVIQGEGWGGPVKSNLKDSVSQDVYQSILNNQMIF